MPFPGGSLPKNRENVLKKCCIFEFKAGKEAKNEGY
jgi:hypothetical protein